MNLNLKDTHIELLIKYGLQVVGAIVVGISQRCVW